MQEPTEWEALCFKYHNIIIPYNRMVYNISPKPLPVSQFNLPPILLPFSLTPTRQEG
jgi:hypothetical protein